MRMPWQFTYEWTDVVPDDHVMAPFVNGQVIRGDEHGCQFKSGTTYRRRVLIWRGRWRLAEQGRNLTTAR